MQIIERDISELIPYSNNPRINATSVDVVASSLKEYGWKQPIVVDKENVVVVGHTRLLAAKKLGLEKVPILVADELTPAQIKGYRLMDNRSSDMSEWDFELVSLELEGLKDLDFDINLTGFDNSYIDINFSPGTEEEQGRLDQLEPKIVKCPECGHNFDTREQE